MPAITPIGTSMTFQSKLRVLMWTWPTLSSCNSFHFFGKDFRKCGVSVEICDPSLRIAFVRSNTDVGQENLACNLSFSQMC